MKISDATFCIVDTETTGSRAGEDRLIEVGAVRMIGGEVVDEFQQLIDPQRHVPRRITRLTGISTAMVYGQPTVKEVMPEFRRFLGDAIMVAHNLPFDLRFLDLGMDEAGLPPIHNPALDTLRLARRLLSALPSKGLSRLTEHFGIEVHGRHRALGDADATAELLAILLDRLEIEFNITTVEELLTFQRKRYKDTRREPSHLKRIREETLPQLPDRPGVYSMRDGRNRVIYVGKAKSLKNRVRSYFVGVENHPPRTKKLVRDVRSVTWDETGTELGALLDESRRIKSLLPVHNRAQRRYRDYPFIRLDVSSAFPTLSWVPRIAHDGAEYYGPLARRGQADELVELIGRLFKLRECDDNIFALGRPCLYHEMGRCEAPCATGDAEAYAEEVNRIRAFLTGQNADALDALELAMHEAAATREFELAAWYRDQRERLERTLRNQRQIAAPVHDHNVVLVERFDPGYDGHEDGGAQLFLIRHGRLATRFDLPATLTDEAVDALRETLDEHFDPTSPPPEQHLRADVDEMRILAAWMRRFPDASRQVRWEPHLSSDEFLTDVLLAAGSAVSDTSAEPVEEEEL
ncbi:MAG: DEDD exonuclease domain-containing protein [Bacteroidota bacterium]